MRSNSKSIYSYYMILPAAALFLVLFAVPSVSGIYYSFTDWRMDTNEVHFIGLDNFKYIFKDPFLVLAIKNTFIFTIITVIGKNVFGILLALGVNAPLRTRNVLRMIFYIPTVMSTIVISLIFSTVLHPDGMLNDFLHMLGLDSLEHMWLAEKSVVMYSISAVAIWSGVGFHMVIYLAGLQSVPGDLHEAAKIDGAGGVRRFFAITLPMLTPAMTTSLMFSLIAGLRVFGEVMVLTGGGPGNSSQVLSTFVYKSFGEGRWGLGTALNTLLFLMVTIISLPLLLQFRKREVEL